MSTQKSNNFLRFLRQNLVLIIIIACVLAITGIILGVSLGKSPVTRSEEHTLNSSHRSLSRMPSSA